MFTSILLYAVLVPLIVSAIASLVMRRMQAPPQIIWPVAVVCGFLAGQLVIRSAPGLAVALRSFIRPHEAVDWLPLVVLLALGVTVVEAVSEPSPFGRGRSGRWRKIALAAALALAVPVRLLSGNVRLTHDWSAMEKLAYLSLLAATLGLVWQLLSMEGDEKHAAIRVPLLILLAAGTAIVLTQSGALMYGLSSGAVATAIAGAGLGLVTRPMTLGSAWRRTDRIVRPTSSSFTHITGAAGVITFSLGSLILLGRFYSELPAIDAALLYISLAGTGIPLPAFLRSGPAWRPITARTMLCVLPLALAVIRVFG